MRLKFDARGASGFARVARTWMLALALGVSGCSGSVAGGGGDDSGEGGDGGAIGGGGESGSGSGGRAGGSGGGSGNPAACRVAAPMKRLTEVQYRNAIRDLFGGVAQPSELFPSSEIKASQTGFSTEPDVNVVTATGAESLLEAAEEVAAAAADKIQTLLPCASTPGEACAKTFITDFGRKVFRRPLRAEEEATFLAAFKKATGADAFKDGIAIVIAAMLQSPQFLYQVETGKPVDGQAGVAELDGYELASRLAFLLWDAPPDTALLDAAAQGKLKDKAELKAQAERLLGHDKAKAVVTRFAREWTHLETLAQKDRENVAFTPELASAIQTEFDLFFQDQFLGAGTTETLFSSRSTFANQALGSFYGVSGAGGATDFKKVTVDQRTRAGMLTLPAFLASKSHTNEPSYVFRGDFVLKKLLCVQLPKPPPDAATRVPKFPDDATQRQKSTLIRGVGECAACHNIIDPIGLSFEAYDEIGKVRTKLPTGQNVDESGEIKDVADDVNGTFKGPVELSERLAKATTVERCVATQMFRFAYARPEGDDDACSIDGLMGRLAKSGKSLRELVLALVTADEFRFRMGGN